jgi:glycosyltransferase involved in cell wall biosynthesis
VNDARPHLLHVFSTFVAAGPQVRVVGLIERFEGRYRHSLVALDGHTEARELLAPGLAAVLDPPPKAGTLATVPRLWALIRRERPDAVLTYNFGAMDGALAARALGRPIVHHEDGFRPDEAARQLLRRALYRRVALRGAAVVVVSETLRRIAIETWRLDGARVHFIPNGIDVASFAPRDGNPELRAALGIPAAALVVGAVGHLRSEKNLPRLVAAAAELAGEFDLHLLILGDGPERERIERAAAGSALAGRVHLVGHQADPRAHYRAMDVFASSSDMEQMPLSLIEAMASALPVVATDVGDVRAMLPERARRWVSPPAAGPAALAAGLRELCLERDLRRSLGQENRRRAGERFERAAMTQAYRELYDAAVARSRASPRAARP